MGETKQVKQVNHTYMTMTSDKDKKTATILCAIGFIGVGGLHDFYVGKIGLGLLKLFTANFALVGTFIDIIKLSTGAYTDNTGAPLRK